METNKPKQNNPRMNLVDFIKTADQENILNYSEVSFDKQINLDNSNQFYMSIPCKSELAYDFDWNRLKHLAERLQNAFTGEYFNDGLYHMITTPRGFLLYDFYAMTQIHLAISDFGIYLTAYFQA